MAEAEPRNAMEQTIPVPVDHPDAPRLRFLVTLRAAAFFQDSFQAAIADAYLANGRVHEQIVVDAFDGPGLPALGDAPESVADFLDKSKHVFSALFALKFRTDCHAFDKLCGAELADAFVAEGTVREWTWLLARNVYERIDELFFEHPPSAPRFDEADEETDPALQIPLLQVSLKGKSLCDAWARNDKIAEMLWAEKIPGLSRWDPATPGTLPVFHGTSAHADCPDMLDDLASVVPRLKLSSGDVTQLYAKSGVAEYAGIYTSFSALKAFLWGVFKSELVRDPAGTRWWFGILREPFLIGNRSFRGSLLLEFASTQPGPAELSWFQVPDGTEPEWDRAVKTWEGSPERFWAHSLSRLHAHGGPNYPDVLHGRDLKPARRALSGLPCNESLLWQTAWLGDKAGMSLSMHMTRIVAVSFEHETGGADHGLLTRLCRVVAKIVPGGGWLAF